MAIKMIRVKYAGKCSSCGGMIARGDSALWNSYTRTVQHMLPHPCANKAADAAAVNDYAGDGFDSRVEDAMAEICGR